MVYFLILCFFAILYFKRNVHHLGLSKFDLPFAFLVKCLAGVVFIYVYFDYYGKESLCADSIAFLNQSKTLHDVFFQSPVDYLKLLTGIGENQELVMKYLSSTHHWDAGNLTLINDSKNVLRINSLIYFLSNGNEYVHIVVIAFFSTFSIYNLFISFYQETKIPQRLFFWLLVLIPSTLFWSAGILKEPFLLLGLSFFVRALLFKDSKFKKILFFSSGILLLLSFKPYVLLCILPALLFYGLSKRKHEFKKSILILLALASLLFGIPKSRDYIVQHLSRKQFDFINVGKGGIHAVADTCIYYFMPEQLANLKISDSNTVILIRKSPAYIIEFGSSTNPIYTELVPQKNKHWKIIYNGVKGNSYIETTYINNSLLQLLKNIPEAFINSTFRPFINDPGKNIKYSAFFEVILLVIGCTLTLFFRTKLTPQKINLIVSIFIFCLLLSLLIGFTTPVIGAIVRYRIPVYLGYFFIMTTLFDYPKFIAFLKSIRPSK